MVSRGSVLKAVAFSLSIALILVVLWLIKVDLFLSLASRLRPAWVALFVAAYTLSFALRAVRWKVIVDAAGGKVGIVRLVSINFSGWFMNEVTPAKLGDLLRISLLASQGGVPLGESTSTIAIERAFDILSIALVSSILIFTASFSSLIPFHIKLITVIVFAILAVILILTLAFCVAGPRIINVLRLHKVSKRMHEVVYSLALGMKDGVQKLSRKPRSLAAATLLSFPIWVTDAFSIYIFINAAGIPELTQMLALVILAGVYPSVWLADAVMLAIFMSPFSSVSAEVCMLSALLGFASKFFPLVPGGFGVYEFVVAVVLGITGLPLNLGLAVALLDHMARLAYCSAAGLPSLIHNGIGVGSILSGHLHKASEIHSGGT
ncbi:MAG: flippase-like domain-containing protein [Candidatus Freyarchaeota archaeon]|nr:flippase-like domain-containing protein [Candidatus Jordarchaeia archaeon]